MVVTGVVAAKNEKLRTKLVGVGLGIAGALAAVVAVLTLQRERDMAGKTLRTTPRKRRGLLRGRSPSKRRPTKRLPLSKMS